MTQSRRRSTASKSSKTTAEAASESWWLFRNDPNERARLATLLPRQLRDQHAPKESAAGLAWPEAPPWRLFQSSADDSSTSKTSAAAASPGMDDDYWGKLDALTPIKDSDAFLDRDAQRGATFQLPRKAGRLTEWGERIRLAVNAAIHLRRPLLVTGQPGSGKTTLAYAIAAELGLGPVLVWPVTPRSRLREDGLYRYDALARLQQADLTRSAWLDESDPSSRASPTPPAIDRYLRLGPVGTAFLPSRWPRVLLIDEIDKGDLQLPSELLHLFEEGRYEIEELTRAQAEMPPKGWRLATADAIKVPDGHGHHQERPPEATLLSGFVRCQEFPIVVMTSNREREFPPAFHRRCIRIGMPSQDAETLKPIVAAHFSKSPDDPSLLEEIGAFLGQAGPDAEGAGQTVRDRAVDQLLNAYFLLNRVVADGPTSEQRELLRTILYRNLSDLSDSPDAGGGSDPTR